MQNVAHSQTLCDGLGWRSVGRPMSQLLAEHGLPPVAQTSDSVSMADTIYYTSTK